MVAKVEVDLEEFKRLYAEGLDDKEIAEALSFSHSTARNIRKKIGLPPQSRFVEPSIINEEFFKHYQQNKSIREIASELHVSYDDLYKWMKKHKYNCPRYTRKKMTGNGIEHITLTIPKTILDDSSDFMKIRGYSNYSEVIRSAIRKFISDYESINDDRHAGIASIIYDRTKGDISGTLTDIQYNYSHLIKFSVYICFGHDSRLEIIVLDGDGEKIKKFYTAMKTRGKVEFSELSIIPFVKKTCQ